MPESLPIAGREHIRVLDGLRGVAILLVLALHFYPRLFLAEANPSLALFLGRAVVFGKYGVELFFVLSGFLITGILVDTKRDPAFLPKFYARRFLRIFPLYYASLFAVIVVLPLFVSLDAGAAAIVSRQAWLWTYTANWPTGWVWDDSQLFMLGHFWSLCVEEHFYLVWPFLVAWLPNKRIFQLSCALVIVAGACREIAAIGGVGSPALLRWLTLQKMDGLAIGAMIAVAIREPDLVTYLPSGAAFRRLFSGVSFLLAILLLLPRRFDTPTAQAIADGAAVLFFGLVLVGVLRSRPTHLSHRMLSTGVLVSFGKYSYGLYVIHGILRPCFARLFDVGGASWWHGLSSLYCILYYALTIGTSFGLAYLSYQLFEKRFLMLKRHFDYTGTDTTSTPSVVGKPAASVSAAK